MASLHLSPSSKKFQIRFRFGGIAYKRSLKTTDKRDARSALSRVEETLRLIERGRIDMPPDANPAEFILSDGKRNDKPKPSAIRTLRDFFRLYEEQMPRGTKEESTFYGEQIHVRHLLRHLKGTTVVRSITTRDLQDYIAARLHETWNGKPIRPATIKKELTTFRLIWNWAVDQGYLSGPAPTKGLKFPKSDEKPPFMTWGEIEAKLARGGLSPHQEEELWSCLFLKTEQIEAVLEHAKLSARLSFVFPMFVFVCHTGARRSEILRSQIDDFDFRTRTVQIREKKKSRSKAMTFRHIPMTDLLHDTMQSWFQNHPGGQFSICQQLATTRGKKRDSFGSLDTIGSPRSLQANAGREPLGKDQRFPRLPPFLCIQPRRGRCRSTHH